MWQRIFARKADPLVSAFSAASGGLVGGAMSFGWIDSNMRERKDLSPLKKAGCTMGTTMAGLSTGFVSAQMLQQLVPKTSVPVGSLFAVAFLFRTVYHVYENKPKDPV
jgi:hypothetical protein